MPMLELSLSKVAFSGTRITMIVWLFFESIAPLLLSEEIIIKRHKCFISIITKISNLLLICSLSQYIVECGLLSRFAKNNGFLLNSILCHVQNTQNTILLWHSNTRSLFVAMQRIENRIQKKILCIYLFWLW